MAIDYNKNFLCTIEYKKGELSSKTLEKFYKNLEKHNVTVGIHKEEGAKEYANGQTVLKNAIVQEFGWTQIVKKARIISSPFTNHIAKKGKHKGELIPNTFYIPAGKELEIPARPFVRIFNDKKEKKDLTEAFKNQIEVYKKSGDAEAVYDGVGYLAKWRMRERIDSKKIKPKNAEMTIEYKGSNTPLYMTGELYFGIESKVH